jgi:hypothetical protein
MNGLTEAKNLDFGKNEQQLFISLEQLVLV